MGKKLHYFWRYDHFSEFSEFEGQKLTNVKKKDFLGPKNKLGQSLRRKKGFLGQKVGKKFENKVQKLSNLKNQIYTEPNEI